MRRIVKSRPGRGLWRLVELGISCAVAPGTGDQICFRMRRTMPAAGLVRGLRVPAHLGRWYEVTSVRVGEQELLREPASAALLGSPGNAPPWLAPARRGEVVSIEVRRVGGSFSFAGAVLCALRVPRRRGRER